MFSIILINRKIFFAMWCTLLVSNTVLTFSQTDVSNKPSKNGGHGKTAIIDTTVTYVVKPGDNLWRIAVVSKGDPYEWWDIYNRNRKTIQDPNILIPGQKLFIRVPLAVSAPGDDSLRITPVSKLKSQKVKKSFSKIKASLSPENLGIGDLVIDRTRSRWGRDFVDLFNKSWNPPENINDYTIVIEERPLPRLGTVILIKVNGNYIYKRFIQPRYETIKINAKQGTEMALSYLEHYKQIQKDLEGEDLKGTGIY